MTAQGIMSGAGSAMNAMFSGLPAVGGSVKEMQDTSFEQIMETSQGGKDEISKAPTSNTGAKEAQTKPQDVKERAKNLFSGESKIKDVKEAPTEEPAEVTDEMTEAVSALLVQVKQGICETLDITEEQLTEAMDTLGLQDADLLSRDNLQQVFLALNEAEPTEFLTNENLFEEFTQLMQMVEEAVEAVNLTPEEVQAVVAATEEIPEDVKAADAEPVIAKQTEEIPEETTEVKEEPVEVQEEAVTTTATETTSEAKTETGDTGEDRTLAHAKKDGDDTVINSETDANVKNVFIDVLANQAVSGTTEADLAMAAQVREIANQIMEQIKITIRPDQTNMELQLNPEHLGRVNLTITEKEGMMTAQFTTQTEVAKEAIESQMATLRESLQNQGIKVEAIEVTVSEFGFEFERDRQSEESGNGESEKRRKTGNFTVEETEEAAPKMADYLNVTDSSVDYSA